MPPPVRAESKACRCPSGADSGIAQQVPNRIERSTASKPADGKTSLIQHRVKLGPSRGALRFREGPWSARLDKSNRGSEIPGWSKAKLPKSEYYPDRYADR